MQNIATLLKDLHTTHDPIKEGWDIFQLGSGALEIEAVNESNKFNDDDMQATKHVIERAIAGDPDCLRGLLIIMARIAEPVIEDTIRRGTGEYPFWLLVPHPVSETARSAVAE